MEYQVSISGNAQELEELAKSLNSPELNITRAADGWIMRSKQFDFLNDFELIRSKANQLLALINGSSVLLRGFKEPVVLNAVARKRDNGGQDVAISCQTAIGLAITGFPPQVKINEKIIVGNFFDYIPEWVVASDKDPDVTKISELLNLEKTSWVNLYRIFEIIRKNVGGEKALEELKWVDQGKIDKFTHTANSPEALGGQSRHGAGNTSPPKNPMRLDEARALIVSIVQSWIHSKI